jgi:hypothetical protein
MTQTCPFCSELVEESHYCRRLGGTSVVMPYPYARESATVLPAPPEGYRLVDDE